MTLKPVSLSEKLKTVLLDLPPISTAPNSVMQLPAYLAEPDPKTKDKIEDRWLEQESAKLYKAIDGAGIVYVMRNPMIARHPFAVGNARKLRYSQPERIGPVEECARYYDMTNRADETAHANERTEGGLVF